MRIIGVAALGLLLSGCVGPATAQPWFDDDAYFGWRGGYARDYYDRDYYSPRYRYGYGRDRDYDRRYYRDRPRVYSRPRNPDRRVVQPRYRAGDCYTPPARPHSTPRLICRY